MNPRKTILLVDDEERILRSLSLLLRSSFDIRTTTRPEQALEWLDRDTFDIIISDQRMPGMDGATFLAQAREKDPHAVRLLLTGYADLEASVRALNEGAIFRYLTKPWHPSALRALMEEVRDLAQQSREVATREVSAAHRIGEEDQACLVLDPDSITYEVTRRLLGNTLPVLWATTLKEAEDILQAQPVAMLVSELWLEDQDISSWLQAQKRRHPAQVVLVTSELRESHRLVELINQARIFHYLPKPLRLGMLSRSLEGALVHCHQVRHNLAIENVQLSGIR